MRFFTLAMLTFMFTVVSAYAEVKVVEKRRQEPDGTHQMLLVAQMGNRSVQLPTRTIYTSNYRSQDKNMWAVNFHETSNYSSTDLVLCHSSQLHILPDLWAKIKFAAMRKGVVPNWVFDRTHFSVKNINRRKLYCQFLGRSYQRQSEVKRGILIWLVVRKGKAIFRVKRA